MKPQFTFGFSIVATAIVLLVAWYKDPSYDTVPTPGMAVYFAVFGFVMASLLIFSANVLLALAKGKKAKSEEELEAIVVPAMQARECDDRILKWTVIPRAIVSGASLGALCAAGIHHFVK
jgi:apolipoprotein N-acyltransferase